MFFHVRGVLARITVLGARMLPGILAESQSFRPEALKDVLALVFLKFVSVRTAPLTQLYSVFACASPELRLPSSEFWLTSAADRSLALGLRVKGKRMEEKERKVRKRKMMCPKQLLGRRSIHCWRGLLDNGREWNCFYSNLNIWKEKTKKLACWVLSTLFYECLNGTLILKILMPTLLTECKMQLF